MRNIYRRDAADWSSDGPQITSAENLPVELLDDVVHIPGQRPGRWPSEEDPG